MPGTGEDEVLDQDRAQEMEKDLSEFAHHIASSSFSCSCCRPLHEGDQAPGDEPPKA
jgi:hypothetical protein